MGTEDTSQQPRSPGGLRRLLDRVVGWIAPRLKPLWSVVSILWLCGFCTVFFFLGAFFFLLNDQGLDFLRRLAEGFVPGEGHTPSNLFFFLGVIAWSLATWYCGRLLLTRRFPKTDPEFFDSTRGLRTWLPRLGGGLVPLVVALGLIRVAWRMPGFGSMPYALAGLYTALAIGLFLFYWKRRAVFRTMFEGKQAGDVQDVLPRGSWLALVASFLLSWALLALLLFSPVAAPTAIGAPALLLLAAASWILFGSMVVTYWPMVKGYPAFTLPLILWAVAISWFNDNHSIRSTTVQGAAAPRQPLPEHFRTWLDARVEKRASLQPYPVFVVAAAGGGIRAAYWTSTVLGRIGDENPNHWPDHLYALSGVSGGSVGIAMHAVQIAERATSWPVCVPASGARAAYQEEAQRTLARDLLSPVFSYLLFPDLVQRFVPFPVKLADRARALEIALEQAVADRNGIGSQRFEQPFVALWPESASHCAPALLLNTTTVETGQRAIASNLVIDRTFLDAVDLLAADKKTQDMPLSTAVHLSARFTYVSPAGTIPASAGGTWGHVVDGGYFENSGSVTARELIERLRSATAPMAGDQHRRIGLHLILIRNDPEAPSLCLPPADAAAFEPQHGLGDAASPIRALLSTRVARGRLAEEHAVEVMRSLREGSSQCESGCVFEFSLRRDPGELDPPLGWSLSNLARERMNGLLGQYDAQFACIRQLLETGKCDQPPGCR